MTTMTMNYERSTQELEQEIERSRARVAADVNALSEKVSPEHLKEAAKQKAMEGVRSGIDGVKRRSRRAGRSVLGAARSNPLPLLMVGAGFGWLLYNARRDPDSEGWHVRERMDGARERMNEARERTGKRLEHARERASERISKARTDAGHYMEENPLAMGAIALAVGAGVGLLLPTSRREDELLGPQRDRLIERTREAAHEIGEVAEHSMREGMRTAKQEAKREASERGYDLGSDGGPGESEFDSTVGTPGTSGTPYGSGGQG